MINTHNGYGNIPPIDVENEYPEIKKYLGNYWENISIRQDKGRTPYNLRNCAYLPEFEKEKIVWARLMRIHKTDYTNFPRFALVDVGLYIVDSLCFITGKDIYYLQAHLNSSIAKHYFKKEIAVLDTGGFQMRQQYVENILVPQISESEQKPFIELVGRILAKKENGEDTTSEEAKIDQMVYKLYGLSEEEIAIVEGGSR